MQGVQPEKISGSISSAGISEPEAGPEPEAEAPQIEIAFGMPVMEKCSSARRSSSTGCKDRERLFGGH
jgi:hypothetical protein